MYNHHTIKTIYITGVVYSFIRKGNEAYRSTVRINSGVVGDELVEGCGIVAHVRQVLLKEIPHIVLNLQEDVDIPIPHLQKK